MHVIRLRAAWEPWLGSEPAGGQQGFLRRFGRPSGLEPGERVLLVVEPACPGSVYLNDVRLDGPAADVFRYDVTGLLQPRNQLVLAVVEIPASDKPGNVPWNVRLEIVGPGDSRPAENLG